MAANPTRILSRGLLSVIASLLLLHSTTREVHATDDAGKLTGIGLISAGAVAICAPFGGGFEIGAGLGLLIFDPPDLANACVSVNPSSYLLSFPDVSTIGSCGPTPPAVATAMNAAMDDMDELVKQVRAMQAARDRYEGALALGNTGCATQRRNEYESFRTQLIQAGLDADASLDAYVAAQNASNPAILATVITKQDVKNVRDLIAGGSFPAMDSEALSAWSVSAAEQAAFQAAFAGLSHAEIDAVFAVWDPINGNAVTLGFGFNNLGNQILSNLNPPSLPPVPGLPSTSGVTRSVIFLLVAAFAVYTLYRASRRRRIA